MVQYLDYENEKFKIIAKGLENIPEGGERCHKCYTLRMEKTAAWAKENNFDYFCTTLSVSPFKNSRVLNEIGNMLEKKYDIKYLYSDFKKEDGYKKSIKETSRRRSIQEKYNKDHNIEPQTIIKSIKDIPTTDEENKESKKMSKQSKKEMLIKIENEMKEAAKALDFEKAMELRDILFELKEKK